MTHPETSRCAAVVLLLCRAVPRVEPVAKCSLWEEQLYHRPKCLVGPEIEPVEGWEPFLDTDGIVKCVSIKQ